MEAERANRLLVKLSVLLLSIGVCLPSWTKASDAFPYGMQPSFSKNALVCKQAFKQLASLSVCRPFDARCPESYNFTSEPPRGVHIATNTYGYTTIYQLRRSRMRDALEPDLEPIPDDELASLPDGVALVFVNRFQGDRHPRVLQTWKLNEAALDAVLDAPFPDIHPKDFGREREHNAPAFEAVLSKGERLSEEWSPMIVISGRAYVVERECSGTWAYGGDYVCNRVFKLTVKRIEADGPSAPYCQLSRRPASTTEPKRRQKP